MKALIIIISMLLMDFIIFALIVPYVFKKGYAWYIKRSSRETVSVNPIAGFIGGVK